MTWSKLMIFSSRIDRQSITRVAGKLELKNRRQKELPLSREVEMLTMLHEGGDPADADVLDIRGGLYS